MSSKKLSVSIVIPNYNGKDLLEKNLPQVIESSHNAEIIVVDDASTDNSVNLLRNNFPQIKIVTHEKNQRFAAACNSGVAKTSGDIIVLLNTDVVPTKDFLKPLLKPFEDPHIFAVGCTEINRSTDKEITSGRSCSNYIRGLVTHWRCPDQTKNSTAWASGGSGAFRKSMWLKLGGMDLLFTPAYEEDRDIAYRAMKRGWIIAFAPKSVVYHDHELTNQRELGNILIQLASYKNHLVFVWKNITQLSYIIQHICWLPYHLIITSIRSKGIFLASFFWALIRLPQIVAKRKIESQEGVISDEAVLASIKD